MRILKLAAVVALGLAAAQGWAADGLSQQDENGIVPYVWWKFDGDWTAYGSSAPTASSPTSNYVLSRDGYALYNGGGWGGDIKSDTAFVWTLCVVAKANTTDNGVIFSLGNRNSSDSSKTRGIALASGGSGKVTVSPFLEANAHGDLITADVATSATEYHFYAITMDADKNVKLYVDGTQYGDAKNLSEYKEFTNDPAEGHWQFGSINGNLNNTGFSSANNNFDDIRFYRQTLTAEQIAKIGESFPVWNEAKTVAASETWTLTQDERCTSLTVNSGSKIDLNGHNLTLNGTLTVNGATLVTNSVESTTGVATFKCTNSLTDQFNNKLTFSGNVKLVVSGTPSNNSGFQGSNNTHTGGTVFDDYNANGTARLNNSQSVGSGDFTLENGSVFYNTSDLGEVPWTNLYAGNENDNTVTNRIASDGTLTINCPLHVPQGAVFKTAMQKDKTQAWNGSMADVKGKLIVQGNGNKGIIQFSNSISLADGTLEVCGGTNLRINHGNQVDGRIEIGALKTPDDMTASTTSAKILNVTDRTTLHLIVGSLGTDTSFYGELHNDHSNTKNRKDIKLEKVGAGTLTLGGENTYMSETIISGGAIKLVGSGRLGNTSNSSDIIFNGGALKIASGLTTTSSSQEFTTSGGNFINVDVDAGTTYTGKIATSAKNGLDKSGDGTLKLTQLSTVAGFALTVRAGALIVPSTYTSNCALFSTKIDESAEVESGYVQLIPDTETPTATDVVTYNGQNYTSVQAAIDAASDAGVTDVALTLLAHVNGAITIPQDMTITVTTGAYAFLCTINGAGTLKYTSQPANLPILGANWTGTVELAFASYSGTFKLADYATASSTVRVNGISGPSVSTAFSDMSAGAFEIGDSGFTMSGNSSGKYIFHADLTGTGTFNTSVYASGGPRTYITGDASGFRGGITAVRNGQANSPVNFIKTDASGEAGIKALPNFNGGAAGAIIVCADNEVTVSEGKTWVAQGGFYIDGTMNLSGSLKGANSKGTQNDNPGLHGKGKIIANVLNSIPSTTFAENTEWTGVIEIPAMDAPLSNTTLTKFTDNAIGNEGSTALIKGIVAGETYGYNFPANIGTTLKLEGSVETKGGSATTIYGIAGDANFTAGTAAHTITTLDNYGGTLDTADGGTIIVGTVSVSSVPNNGIYVATTADCDIDVSNTTLVIGGEATNYRLKKATGGGLVIDSVASAGGVNYNTVAEAIAAANASEEINEVTVSRSNVSEALTITSDVTIKLADGVVLSITSLTVSGSIAFTKANGAEDACVIFPVGTSFAGLTVDDGISVSVTGGVSQDTLLFSYTAGDGYSFETVGTEEFGNIHWSSKVANGVTSVTAGKLFYWAGNSTSDQFVNAANWSTLEDVSDAATTTEVPTYFDTAILGKTGHANGATWGSGNGEYKYSTNYWFNIKIVGDFNFFGTRGSVGYFGSSQFSPTFDIAENAKVAFSIPNQGGADFYVYSKFSGAGEISASMSKNGTSLAFNGDMSEWTGTMTGTVVSSDATFGQIRLKGNSPIDASKSKWDICTTGEYMHRIKYGTLQSGYTFFAEGATYDIGVLRIGVGEDGNNKNLTINLGEKIDESSLIKGSWNPSLQNNTVVWKAASATLTMAITNTSAITVANTGTLMIESSAVDGEGSVATKYIPTTLGFTGAGYLKFDASNSSIAGDIINAVSSATAAVGFDTDETIAVDSVTATALLSDASFNKKGTGALTLKGAFTSLGTITVVDGSLVIKTTTALTKDTSYFCGTGTSCAETTEDEGATYVYTFAVDSGVINVDSGAGVISVDTTSSWYTTALGSDDAATAKAKLHDVNGTTYQAANGLSYFACYATGLSTTDADALPDIAEATVDAEGNISFNLPDEVTVPSGVTLTVTMKSYNEPDGVADTTTDASVSGSMIVVGGGATTNTLKIDPTSIGNTVKFFKFSIVISASE